jgi:hypothetical protein
MGNLFSFGEEDDLTEEGILDDFLNVDGLVNLEIRGPLDIDDIPTENEDIQCKICDKNFALFTTRPCNHRCICNSCLRVISEQNTILRCPQPNCNKIITKIV